MIKPLQNVLITPGKLEVGMRFGAYEPLTEELVSNCSSKLWFSFGKGDSGKYIDIRNNDGEYVSYRSEDLDQLCSQLLKAPWYKQDRGGIFNECLENQYRKVNRYPEGPYKVGMTRLNTIYTKYYDEKAEKYYEQVAYDINNNGVVDEGEIMDVTKKTLG